MKKFVRVIVKEPDGIHFWEGDYLAEFPFFRQLSVEDLLVWNEWLDRPELDEFLDGGIAKCQTQSEINKEASGWAVIRNGEENDDGHIIGDKEIKNPLKNSH